jgi:hypothetical protein
MHRPGGAGAQAKGSRMNSSARPSWSRILMQALLAGIAGGFVFDSYLWLTTLLPQHAGIASLWQWIASTALGKPAPANSDGALIGAAMHAIVSIGWAGGYAYIAATRPATTQRWIVSGIVYGLIVYTIMQVILLADNNFTYPPNPNAFVNALIAHAVFFGIPVAFVVRVLRPRDGS